jgi:hypothetical protein
MWPNTGNPGGHSPICFTVRSATPGVSLSSPKMNDVMA